MDTGRNTTPSRGNCPSHRFRGRRVRRRKGRSSARIPHCGRAAISPWPSGRKSSMRGRKHREIRFRDRLGTAFLAMDDRYGRSPVPLTGNAPVVETVIHLSRPLPLLLEPAGDRTDGLTGVHAVEASEFIMRPSPVYACSSRCAEPSGEMTSTTGIPNSVANSKSRSSWAGTA